MEKNGKGHNKEDSKTKSLNSFYRIREKRNTIMIRSSRRLKE